MTGERSGCMWCGGSDEPCGGPHHREQPRGGPPRNTSQNSPTKETITGNVIETTSTRCLGCGCTPPLHFVGCDKAAWPPRQERQLRADLAAALASIRTLETLRDVHRRTIDDLISEAQTAGATIDELRAEGEEAARQAREWAALARRWHAEVSRLREQGDRLASALERTRHNFVAAVRGSPVRDMTETLAEVDAALAASSETPQDAP